MKLFLKILAGLALFAVLAVGAALYLTVGITRSADDFFAAVERDDLAAARGLLSQQFLASVDEPGLRRFLGEDLGQVTQTSWSSRVIENGSGRLVGELTTRSGGTVPVKIALVKEDAGWRIQAIERSLPTGLVEARPPLPAPDAQAQLVAQSLRDFGASAAAGSMRQFRDSTSRLWQEQFSLERFEESYRGFLGVDFDWSFADQLAPAFDGEAGINEDGVLVLSGHYAPDAYRVNFTQKFVREQAQWRLIGFSLQIQ